MSETNEKKMSDRNDGVRELLDVTRSMANGDFSREIESDLYGELGELARYINITFRKLQTLEPNIKLSSEKIPMATSQLSDITRATEEATNRILELTEKVLDNHDLISSGIERVKGSDRLDKSNIGELDKLVSDNKESLIEIITCLSFQDLTGQKINKIMVMMRDVESRILELIVTFGLKAKNKETSMDGVTSPILNELKKPVSDDLKQDLVDDMLKRFGF
ncbi:MAG: protein phosphatase CheZ [Nitrospirae bacterium]|nr:protein phosphatase CheZ [Nitrospirota bacterium]